MLLDARCKKCRRAGQKLFLKGDRCFSPKCAMIKRPTPPGLHGSAKRRRSSDSEYGKQLAEKQRMKRIYGLNEGQFKKYADEAMKKQGDTREILMKKLEMRLDNVVFRLGWTKSKSSARQLVNHGHVFINGKRVSIPSFQVKKGQVISLSPKIRKSNLTKDLPTILKKYEPPVWLSLNKENLEGMILGEPAINDLGDLGQAGLVVDFYSR